MVALLLRRGKSNLSTTTRQPPSRADRITTEKKKKKPTATQEQRRSISARSEQLLGREHVPNSLNQTNRRRKTQSLHRNDRPINLPGTRMIIRGSGDPNETRAWEGRSRGETEERGGRTGRTRLKRNSTACGSDRSAGRGSLLYGRWRHAAALACLRQRLRFLSRGVVVGVAGLGERRSLYLDLYGLWWAPAF